MAEKADLTSRQKRVLGALLAGATQGQAAEAAGVSSRTVRRYCGNPAFRARLSEATDGALGDVVRKLHRGGLSMLAVLQQIAEDAKQPSGVRVRASEVWLTQLWRAREVYELAERVAKLEQALGGGKERV